ncbi:MAG: thiolase family protein [Gammaproteobacteria bacterium]|nr:thiolase family protein [Gammaproteobacteria bacterium]
MVTGARSYEGVAVLAPMTVPYEKSSPHGAARFLGRTLRGLIDASGIHKRDIDGLAVSSFSLAPDTAVSMTEHFGMSVRYVEQLVTGGASGVMALKHAARAIQCGDADIVACIAGDTCRPGMFADLVANFSRFSRDAVHPYGGAGPNGVFAMITRAYMEQTGATREDFGRICIAQRHNAGHYPHALLREPLTLEEYLAARPIAEPLHRFDCVMPCAGGEGFLVMSEDRARALRLPYAQILAAEERHNAWFDDAVQLRGGWALYRDALYAAAGLGPADMQFLQTYDDYPVIVMQQLEDLGYCASGDAPRFVRETALTFDGGGLPHNTSGGQLSVGQAGFAGGFLGTVEALRQLIGPDLGNRVPRARVGMVSGYGMVMYDHCLCTAAAILARGDPA